MLGAKVLGGLNGASERTNKRDRRSAHKCVPIRVLGYIVWKAYQLHFMILPCYTASSSRRRWHLPGARTRVYTYILCECAETRVWVMCVMCVMARTTSTTRRRRVAQVFFYATRVVGCRVCIYSVRVRVFVCSGITAMVFRKIKTEEALLSNTRTDATMACVRAHKEHVLPHSTRTMSDQNPHTPRIGVIVRHAELLEIDVGLAWLYCTARGRSWGGRERPIGGLMMAQRSAHTCDVDDGRGTCQCHYIPECTSVCVYANTRLGWFCRGFL